MWGIVLRGPEQWGDLFLRLSTNQATTERRGLTGLFVLCIMKMTTIIINSRKQ